MRARRGTFGVARQGLPESRFFLIVLNERITSQNEALSHSRVVRGKCLNAQQYNGSRGFRDSKNINQPIWGAANGPIGLPPAFNSHGLAWLNVRRSKEFTARGPRRARQWRHPRLSELHRRAGEHARPTCDADCGVLQLFASPWQAPEVDQRCAPTVIRTVCCSLLHTAPPIALARVPLRHPHPDSVRVETIPDRESPPHSLCFPPPV